MARPVENAGVSGFAATGAATGQIWPRAGRKSFKALFYCHDTLGLGHFRRTVAICQGLLQCFENLSALILTGSPMAHAFRLGRGLDYVKLPSVRKLDNELYESRSLDVPFETVLQIRSELIYRTACSYRPDFFFVDNVPLGMKNEILGTLQFLQDELPWSRRLLILRDILDDAGYLIPFWRQTGGFEALETFYHRILICGQPAVFDAVEEYAFPPSVKKKTRFCGYIARESGSTSSEDVRRRFCSNGEKMVLVTVGGGSDGSHVVKNYLRSLPEISSHCPVSSVILLGPEMDKAEAEALLTACPTRDRVTVLDFYSDSLALMEAADVVVSMAGYNTVNEIVWLRKPAVVIPRIKPRTEQLIRSQRLQELSFLEMIHPDVLTPQKLAEFVLRGLEGNSEEPTLSLCFDAVNLIARELDLLPDQEGPVSNVAGAG